MKYTVVFDDDLGVVFQNMDDVTMLVDFMNKFFQKYNSDF